MGFHQFEKRYTNVIGGYTLAVENRCIAAIAAAGVWCAIDLEAIAMHKGSAFWETLTMVKQPSPKCLKTCWQ